MESKRISVAEAKARLSSVVDGVLHGAERYVIERRGKPVAALVSVDDLEFIKTRCPDAARPAGALALLGLWEDLDDAAIDEFVREVYEAREGDTGRLVKLEP